MPKYNSQASQIQLTFLSLNWNLHVQKLLAEKRRRISMRSYRCLPKQNLVRHNFLNSCREIFNTFSYNDNDVKRFEPSSYDR